MASAVVVAFNRIERAHQLYRDGRHDEALAFYTEALAMAKTKAQKIALHSNRAACYLKLHDFKKAAEECTSVLELDHNHTGALMLRAQTLVTLKEYQSALFDVNRLIELNPSSDVYHNLQARLKTQLSLTPIPESEEEAFEAELEEALEAELEEEAREDELEEESMKAELEEEAMEDELEEESMKAELKEKTMEADDQQENAVGAVVISDRKAETPSNNSKLSVPQAESLRDSDLHPKGWEAIPKPKGHSGLDYSRWDQVEDDSSEEDEAEDVQPQYRFRVRTVGVRPVK